MKKSIKIISALMAVLLIFAGCSKSEKANTEASDDSEKNAAVKSESSAEKSVSVSEKTDKEKGEIKSKKNIGFSLNVKERFTEKGKKIISYFGEKYSYKTILEDISEINLALKPDFNKSEYTVKNVADEESSTNIVQYYNGNTLIYEKFRGFGEAGYVYYTKTKSGAAAKVYYYHDENEKVYNTVIKTDVCTANIDMQNKSEKSDPQTVIITAEKKSAGKLSENIMYSACNGFITVEKALYYSKDGYIDYYSWIDVDNRLNEDINVKFTELDSPTDEDTVKKIKSNTDISIIQTLMGRHRLAYKRDKWFITTDLYVLFANETEAKKYAKQNGIGEENISNEYASDGGAFYVLYKDITLPISDRFLLNGEGGLNNLASAEFNDLTFADITTDDSGNVTEIEYNNSVLSCY